MGQLNFHVSMEYGTLEIDPGTSCTISERLTAGPSYFTSLIYHSILTGGILQLYKDVTTAYDIVLESFNHIERTVVYFKDLGEAPVKKIRIPLRISEIIYETISETLT